MDCTLYHYRMELIRVIDGDTVEGDLDLGFNVRQRMKFRLDGINAPEKNTAAGIDAAVHLTNLLVSFGKRKPYTTFGGPTHHIVETIKDKDDKYGRPLLVIWLQDDDGNWFTANDRMVAEGHAKYWDGRGPKPLVMLKE